MVNELGLVDGGRGCGWEGVETYVLELVVVGEVSATVGLLTLDDSRAMLFRNDQLAKNMENLPICHAGRSSTIDGDFVLLSLSRVQEQETALI